MLPAFYLNCLNSLAPGVKLFLTGVNFTKKKGFGQFSLAAYWKRKYRGSPLLSLSGRAISRSFISQSIQAIAILNELQTPLLSIGWENAIAPKE